MNLRVVFARVPLSELGASRSEYLEGLSEPQAPLLEVMVPEAHAYAIRSRADEFCGHLLVRGGDALIEFHLRRPFWVFGEAIARQAVDRLALRRAVIQQFDALFLSSCVPLQLGVRCLGLISRDYEPRPLPELPGVRFTSRVATPDDLPAIRAVEQDVFTHPERLAGVLSAGHMRLYEQAGRTIGFGIMRPLAPANGGPVAPGTPVELGIAVDRPFRARGYSVYILRSMIEACLAAGMRPIGGCSEDNRASRHMAERAGLVARYRLMELALA